MPIAFVAANTGVATGSSNISVTIPVAASARDLLIAVVIAGDGRVVSVPTGWTEFSTSPAYVTTTGEIGGIQPAAGPDRYHHYYHFVSSGEAGASVTWVFTGSSGRKLGAIVTYSGVSQENPINAVGSTIKTDPTAGPFGAYGDFIAPGVTPGSLNTMLVSVHASTDVLIGGPFSPPTGMTERVDIESGAGPIYALSINDQILSDTSATGSRTPTASDTLFSQTGTAFLFVLSPEVFSPGVGSGVPSPSAPIVLHKPLVIPMRQNFFVLAEFFPVGSQDVRDLINSGADDDLKVIEFHFNGILIREVN